MTNAAVAKLEAFQLLCKAAGVPPTKRQASKYRREVGRVARVVKYLGSESNAIAFTRLDPEDQARVKQGAPAGVWV